MRQIEGLFDKLVVEPVPGGIALNKAAYNDDKIEAPPQ
jgi:hypothetical protein